MIGQLPSASSWSDDGSSSSSLDGNTATVADDGSDTDAFHICADWSPLAVTTIRSVTSDVSGLKLIELTEPQWPRYCNRQAPVSNDHIRAVWSEQSDIFVWSLKVHSTTNQQTPIRVPVAIRYMLQHAKHHLYVLPNDAHNDIVKCHRQLWNYRQDVQAAQSSTSDRLVSLENIITIIIFIINHFLLCTLHLRFACCFAATTSPAIGTISGNVPTSVKRSESASTRACTATW
jgi:hypothetical protein